MMTVSTTASVTPLAQLALIFGINDTLMARAVEDLSEQECSRRLTEQSNSILWIFSHAVDTRAFLLKQLGESCDTGWGTLFARGVPYDSAASYPSREEVLRMHGEISGKLQAKLATLDETTLAMPGPDLKIPAVKTVADVIGFFALHDSYHVGQMAFVRKALGHSQLVG
jgi:uncharacterized damage-inducible protein DinB